MARLTPGGAVRIPDGPHFLAVAADGTITTPTAPDSGDPDELLAALDAAGGFNGHDRLRLLAKHETAAFVGDRSLLDGSPRNVLGGCLAAALGAPLRPYAGTVVFTGWTYRPVPAGRIEVRPMDPEHTRGTVFLADLVHHALSHPHAPAPPGFAPDWPQAINHLAQIIRDSNPLGLQVFPL